MAASAVFNMPPEMKGFIVGIIGMGDMGRMYAQRLGDAGWDVIACDKEENYEGLCKEFSSRVNICSCLFS
ncbi:hypothetical protein GGS21DRAFT_510824 [Xylaria nigripes]|nr:hypothetical protein GGS21DRAFT_510824 [Xylaria nigripes]